MQLIRTKHFWKKITIILVIVGVLFTLNSCNFILDNDKKENKLEATQQKNVDINIAEAQLLVKMAKTNSDIITLSSVAKEKEDSLTNIAHTLEKNHISISEKLNDIAEEKLILIPDTTLQSEIEIIDLDSNDFSEKYLKTVNNLLENQIEILNKLSEETLDEDFKELSSVTTKKILDHLNKTEILLSKS